MAIEDLTGQLKQLKEHGEADLQLSPAIKEQYVAAIQTFRGVLEEQRDKARELRYLPYPGGYASAYETKNRLLLNVQDTDGIVATLNKYIDYLNEFEATVNAACKRLHGEDADTGSGEVLTA
jgi:hypothetical protein